MKTTIHSTFQATKDTSTGSGTGKTNIEDAFKGFFGLTVIEVIHDIVVATINFFLTGKVQLVLGVHTTGQQKTSAVSRSIVGQTSLDSIAGKFMRIGRGNDFIMIKICRNDLHDNVSVCTSEHQAELRSFVLVLVLNSE